MAKVKHIQTFIWMMTLTVLASLALGQTAYAEEAGNRDVEAIIRRERAKVGDRIDALDSIIGRSQDQASEPTSYVPARYAGAEPTPHRVSERSQAPTDAKSSAQVSAQVSAQALDRSSEYYSPAAAERISDRLIPAPVKTEEIEVKGEDGIRGEDVAADNTPDQEPPPRVRLPPVFDMGSSRAIPPTAKPQSEPLDRQVAPTRLTDVHPAQPAVEKSSNGLWDDLTAARERARRAIVESWQGEDAGRAQPQNYPSGYSDTNRFRAELSAAERLAPQQAGIGIPSFQAAPERRSITEDVIAAEVAEVEQELRPARRRLLGNLTDGESSDSVPMLRPKRLAGRMPSKRAVRSIASTLSRNPYAKGSRPGERRQTEEEQFQPSTYKYVPENFYRHLSPKGTSSVRTHNVYGDVE